MKNIMFGILLCFAFNTSYTQDTISFPGKISKFVKVDSINVESMYMRALSYYTKHNRIATNRKKTKSKEVVWMVADLKNRQDESYTTAGHGIIPYQFNCMLGTWIGALEYDLKIVILSGGFDYSIENVTHKSIDGTFDFGPLTSYAPQPHQYKNLYPLPLKCWTSVKKSALVFCEQIGKEITEKITTGSIVPTEILFSSQ